MHVRPTANNRDGDIQILGEDMCSNERYHSTYIIPVIRDTLIICSLKVKLVTERQTIMGVTVATDDTDNSGDNPETCAIICM